MHRGLMKSGAAKAALGGIEDGGPAIDLALPGRPAWRRVSRRRFA
jgi:hypothetical protein